MRLKSRQHGFGLVAAMFVIIIITAVITAMARLAETQNATNSMAIQQARAYQAARAGLEYGVAQVLASGGCSSFSLDGFAVGVTCVQAPTSPVNVPEENQNVTFYTVTATAEFGGAGNPDYAYRQLTVLVEP